MQNHQTAYNQGRQNNKLQTTKAKTNSTLNFGNLTPRNFMIISQNGQLELLYQQTPSNFLFFCIHLEKQVNRNYGLFKKHWNSVLFTNPCQQMTKCTLNLKTLILVMICTGGSDHQTDHALEVVIVWKNIISTTRNKKWIPAPFEPKFDIPKSHMSESQCPKH